MNRRIGAIILIGFTLLAFVGLFFVPGCEDSRHPPAGSPGTIKAATGEIGTRAASIDKHADAIDAITPDAKPETAGIREDTGALRVLQGKLDTAGRECAEKDKAIAGLSKKMADLEAEKKTGLRSRLVALVSLGLLGLAVGIGITAFGSKAIGVPMAISGVSLAGGALVFQTLLDYAVQITLGVVGIGAVALLVYALGLKQVTHFAEAAKKETDLTKIEQLGREGQSWFTRKVLVKGIRKRLGVA